MENVLAEKKGSHVNDAISTVVKAYADFRHGGGTHEIQAGQKAMSTIRPPEAHKAPDVPP
jgi:hypothetical protein